MILCLGIFSFKEQDAVRVESVKKALESFSSREASKPTTIPCKELRGEVGSVLRPASSTKGVVVTSRETSLSCCRDLFLASFFHLILGFFYGNDGPRMEGWAKIRDSEKVGTQDEVGFGFFVGRCVR